MEATLNKLAIEMFKTFSRFEYALKAAGFHNGEGKAEPNWRAFSESITEHLKSPNTDELAESIKYIIEQPPNKQIIENNILSWSEAKPNTNTESDLILLYVRRVRNNLFHGGKFNGHWFAPERSEQLSDRGFAPSQKVQCDSNFARIF